MDRFLEGKVALVTGAGRGIGRCEAIALADAGACVVVNDNGSDVEGEGFSRDPADDVAQEIIQRGGKAVANYDTVADYDAAGNIVQQTLDTYGRIDILVNNAGIVGADWLEDYTPIEWSKTIDIMLTGTYNMCRHAVPHMKKQNYGRIINTISNSWNLPTGIIGYAAAKGGVVTFTWALAYELRPFNITVNAIAPFGLTRVHEKGMGRTYEKVRQGIVSKERVAMTTRDEDPMDSTPLLLFLMTPEADEVNGLVLRNGGGKISRFSHPEESVFVWRDNKKDGPWTVDELRKLLPATLLSGSKKAAFLDR